MCGNHFLKLSICLFEVNFCKCIITSQYPPKSPLISDADPQQRGMFPTWAQLQRTRGKVQSDLQVLSCVGSYSQIATT